MQGKGSAGSAGQGSAVRDTAGQGRVGGSNRACAANGRQLANLHSACRPAGTQVPCLNLSPRRLLLGSVLPRPCSPTPPHLPALSTPNPFLAWTRFRCRRLASTRTSRWNAASSASAGRYRRGHEVQKEPHRTSQTTSRTDAKVRMWAGPEQSAGGAKSVHCLLKQGRGSPPVCSPTRQRLPQGRRARRPGAT